MTYAHVGEWKAAALAAGYTIKQVQGFEQYEAWDGDHLMGRWSDEGALMVPSPPEEGGQIGGPGAPGETP